MSILGCFHKILKMSFGMTRRNNSIPKRRMGETMQANSSFVTKTTETLKEMFLWHMLHLCFTVWNVSKKWSQRTLLYKVICHILREKVVPGTLHFHCSHMCDF